MGASKSIHQSSEIPLCDSQNVPSIPPTPETACRWGPHAAAFPWRVRRTHAPAQQETQSHSQRQGQPLHPAPSARQGIPCQLQHFLDSRSFPTWNLRLWNPGRQKLLQDGQSFSIKLIFDIIAMYAPFPHPPVASPLHLT